MFEKKRIFEFQAAAGLDLCKHSKFREFLTGITRHRISILFVLEVLFPKINIIET